MNKSYNNPMVTYDEIVEALKSILECSLGNNYNDDFDYLNVKYQTETSTKLDLLGEKALCDAIKSLKKSIETSARIIKSGLERELIALDSKIFKIHSDYLVGHEQRKLSVEANFISKLKNASLKTDELYYAPQYEVIHGAAIESLIDTNTNTVFSDFEKRAIANFPEFFKEELELANDNVETIDNDKVMKIRKALKKAIQLGNEELATLLKEQLDKEMNK